MATIITYPSALQYWLYEKGVPYFLHRNYDRTMAGNEEIIRLKMNRKEIIQSVGSLFFPAPVHVAVTGLLKRNSTKDVVFHQITFPLPENSFHKINDDLYIASPELCFVRAAEHLSISELVLLANDLCAIYVKDETEEYRQRRRDPVTTVESICSFMNKASGINGLKKARRAIQYVLDRSNSPMESKLAALAVLPLHYGGYGLSKPFLNHFVRLNKEAEEFFGQSQLCCDMVWLAKKVILEYDSNLSHLEIHQHFKDKKRSTALTISGYKVISITAEQLRDFHSVDNMFMQLRHVLNMRTHKDRIDKFAELRWNVVHDLMFKKRCYE